MHDSAFAFGKLFFNTYAGDKKKLIILDIGSQDVNGSLRSLAPKNSNYIGVDFENGKGVDIVIDDPYKLPFDTNSADIIVSSSCFEHSNFFWLVFIECLRVLKPCGILYINAPSNGIFHRYPIDSWRFYPDAGLSLESFGKRSGYNCALLESFIDSRNNEIWNDFVAVFIKDQNDVESYKSRMLNKLKHYTNAHLFGTNEIFHFSGLSPELITRLSHESEIQRLNKIITDLKSSRSVLGWEIMVLTKRIKFLVKKFISFFQ